MQLCLSVSLPLSLSLSVSVSVSVSLSLSLSLSLSIFILLPFSAAVTLFRERWPARDELDTLWHSIYTVQPLVHRHLGNCYMYISGLVAQCLLLGNFSIPRRQYWPVLFVLCPSDGLQRVDLPPPPLPLDDDFNREKN
jgi:hypothetical protein